MLAKLPLSKRRNCHHSQAPPLQRHRERHQFVGHQIGELPHPLVCRKVGQPRKTRVGPHGWAGWADDLACRDLNEGEENETYAGFFRQGVALVLQRQRAAATRLWGSGGYELTGAQS